jgi:seryl-tRNA synthetase
MALREKRYKYIEDVVEDYIRLQDERIELPLAIEKAKKKQEMLFSEIPDKVIQTDDAEDLFKAFSQVKKSEERLAETNEEITEVEEILKGFLAAIPGHQLAYERKDDLEKMKITHLFWLEDGVIKSNR